MTWKHPRRIGEKRSSCTSKTSCLLYCPLPNRFSKHGSHPFVPPGSVLTFHHRVFWMVLYKAFPSSSSSNIRQNHPHACRRLPLPDVPKLQNRNSKHHRTPGFAGPPRCDLVKTRASSLLPFPLPLPHPPSLVCKHKNNLTKPTNQP